MYICPMQPCSKALRAGVASTVSAVCFVLCAVRMDARLRSDRYFGFARQQRFDFRTMHNPPTPLHPSLHRVSFHA